MYLLMRLLFGSFTLPLAVLISVDVRAAGNRRRVQRPDAEPQRFHALLGVAMLVGIVGKNAILLVDYTDTLRKRGADRTAALLEAGPTRLRPILMTTLSIIFGL